jgi:hypothetical protein
VLAAFLGQRGGLGFGLPDRADDLEAEHEADPDADHESGNDVDRVVNVVGNPATTRKDVCSLIEFPSQRVTD